MKVFALLLALLAVVCAVAGVKNEVCDLPHSVIGHCRAAHPRFSYNKDTNECVNFFYGGCGGNENRFLSQAECEETCKE